MQHGEADPHAEFSNDEFAFLNMSNSRNDTSGSDSESGEPMDGPGWQQFHQSTWYQPVIERLAEEIQYRMEGKRVLKYWPNKGWVICLTEKETAQVLAQSHHSALVGHYKSQTTQKRLEQNYWWPSLAKDIEKWVAQCSVCQKHEPTLHHRANWRLVTTQPFEIIQMDWVTALPTTPCGNECIIVGLDMYTGYVFAKAARAATAQQTVEFFT